LQVNATCDVFVHSIMKTTIREESYKTRENSKIYVREKNGKKERKKEKEITYDNKKNFT